MRKSGREISDLVARLVELGSAAMTSLGVNAETAREAMRDVAHDWCREHGGQQLYLPRDVDFGLSRRDLEIWEAFSGSNTTALAERHGLTVRQVQSILRRVRREQMRSRQAVLPGLEPADDAAPGRPES